MAVLFAGLDGVDSIYRTILLKGSSMSNWFCRRGRHGSVFCWFRRLRFHLQGHSVERVTYEYLVLQKGTPWLCFVLVRMGL